MKPTVDYAASARRHLHDAKVLRQAGRDANAGQLFGFTIECGLKAALVATRVVPATDAAGNIPPKSPWRKHMPDLGNLITQTNVQTNGRLASLIQGHLHHLGTLHDWSIDHRYFRVSAIPLISSLNGWEQAALEAGALLDEMKTQGLF
jgi:hypothetical protein